MDGEERGWGYFQRFLNICGSAISRISCDGQITSNRCESEVLDVGSNIFPARSVIIVLDDMNDVLDSKHSCLSAMSTDTECGLPANVAEAVSQRGAETTPSVSHHPPLSPNKLTIKQHNIQRLLDFQRSIQHNQSK